MKKDRNKSTLDKKPEEPVKPRVLVDLDGVVRDFVGSLIRVYNRVHPDHKVRPVNSRRLEEFFPLGEGIYRFMEPGYIEEIMEEARPYPDALDALRRWKDDFDIVIVSAQPEISKASTYIWIGKHDIPTNEVHISYNKHFIDGFALLDDFTDNLHDFAETGRLAVCLDQPWNQDWPGPRVKTVDDFFRLVQSHLYNKQVQTINHSKTV
jgi:5'(3')-deoxyribonucleotidase